jgi:hypothetical protein
VDAVKRVRATMDAMISWKGVALAVFRYIFLQHHTLGLDSRGARTIQGTAVPSTPHPVVPQ